MKRILTTILVVVWCVAAAWLAGLDFNARGIGVFFTFVYSTVFAGLIYTYPGWDK